MKLEVGEKRAAHEEIRDEAPKWKETRLELLLHDRHLPSFFADEIKGDIFLHLLCEMTLFKY